MTKTKKRFTVAGLVRVPGSELTRVTGGLLKELPSFQGGCISFQGGCALQNNSTP